jgi:hypothetical protein
VKSFNYANFFFEADRSIFNPSPLTLRIMKNIWVTCSLIICLQMQSQNCDFLCNGSFDTPSVTTGVVLTNSLNCWNTMGTDGKMEVWGTGFNGVPSYDGNQHVELNGTQAATMYQDFNAPGGMALTVGFAHRGRAGIDSLEVLIGPGAGPYTSLGRWGDGTTAWGYYTAGYSTTSAGIYRILFKPVYWSGGNIAIGNFLDAVSASGKVLFVSAASTLVCAGTQVVLSASGGTSYAWSGGPTTSTYAVNPSATTVYTVNGTTASGCTTSATFTVGINPGPHITAIATKSVLCKKDASTTLTAGGGTAYVWSPGAATVSSISSGSATTTYSVVGTGTNGCKSTATVQVVINPCNDLSEGLAGTTFIFPNPSSGHFNVSVIRPATLTCLSADGRIVGIRQLDSGFNSIAFEGLAPGIYMMRIDGAGTSSIVRHIVTEK